MTRPTDMDPTLVDQSEREPHLDDTNIIIKDERVRAQLEAKLQEYRVRYAEFAALTPAQRVEQFGDEQYSAIFREQILETVLALSLDESRTRPIDMLDVGVAVQDTTGFNLGRAMTTPFIYSEDALSYVPNERRLYMESDFVGARFSNAYMLIKTYAKGQAFGIDGGTGLPVLPLAPLERR